MYDLQRHEPFSDLLPVDTIVLSMAFNQAGTLLAAGDGAVFAAGLFRFTDEGQIQLWEMSHLDWLKRACSLSGRNLSQEEWDRYLFGRDYRCTCPDLPPGEGTGLDTCPTS